MKGLTLAVLALLGSSNAISLNKESMVQVSSESNASSQAMS